MSHINRAQNYSMDALNKSLVGISSSLSTFGSLLIIATYLLHKDIRTISRKIIVYISVADLFTTVSNFCGLWFKPPADGSPDIPCIVQSFIGTSAVLSSFLWTVVLALFLFFTFVKENPRLARRIFPIYHPICWGVPLTINIVALSLKKLGNSGDQTSSGWCWIKLCDIHDDKRQDQIMWMIIDGKGIEIASYIAVMFLYIRIKYHLTQTVNADVNESTPFVRPETLKVVKAIDMKLMLIPILFICIRIWGTVRFFIFVVNPLRVHEALPVYMKILISLQAVGDNLQGAVNCLLFCFLTPKVSQHIKGWFTYRPSKKHNQPVNSNPMHV